MSAAEEGSSGRIEVLAGGSLSPEELAAVVVALTPGSASEDGVVTAPAWARAGMLEATGHRGFTSAPDLEGYAFDL